SLRAFPTRRSSDLGTVAETDAVDIVSEVDHGLAGQIEPARAACRCRRHIDRRGNILLLEARTRQHLLGAVHGVAEVDAGESLGGQSYAGERQVLQDD